MGVALVSCGNRANDTKTFLEISEGLAPLTERQLASPRLIQGRRQTELTCNAPKPARGLLGHDCEVLFISGQGARVVTVCPAHVADPLYPAAKAALGIRVARIRFGHLATH